MSDNTYKQENDWLRDEKTDLINLLKAIVLDNNNEIRVTARSLAMAKNYQFKDSKKEGSFVTIIGVEQKCLY
jgi:hypothetical protein